MLFPLFLRLEDKRVLVVGGGTVAEKKAIDLADAGAKVTVVAPEISEAIAGDERITKERRTFEESDVDDAWLVVAATDDPITQRRACEAADTAHLFSIAVDDPPNGSAYSASVLRRGSFTVAISSTGEAPALTRLLREVLEQALPEEDWLDQAKALRERWRRDGTPMTSRFAELVKSFKERAGGGG